MTHGAAVIIENRHGEVLLLRRSALMSWKPGYWNLPGGHVEPGERAADAAKREAFEEASLRVGAVTPVVRVHLAPFIVHFYYAKRWTGRVRLNEENIEYQWVPRSHAWHEDYMLETHRRALHWFDTRF